MHRLAPILAVAALTLSPLALPSQAPAAPDAAALRALLEGRLNDAIPQLQLSLQQSPSPANELLLCRALLSEAQLDDALPHCQAAADSPSPTSAAFLWLGRVEGGRASKANALAAFGIARKVKAAFARAVELDPRNTDAVADLGEYLVEAPAIVGGGKDDARDLATRSLSTTPSAAHHILARIAG
ncbi:MAG: hypothetical protein INR64_16045, partial [Caulobacteraceae bacterium]|nr:hypothetical protein [Caulobacter sp.]